MAGQNELNCPRCMKLLQVSSQLRGHQVVCPYCGLCFLSPPPPPPPLPSPEPVQHRTLAEFSVPPEPEAKKSAWNGVSGCFTVVSFIFLYYYSVIHKDWMAHREWMSTFDKHTRDGGMVVVTKDGNVNLTSAEAVALEGVPLRPLADQEEENARRLRIEATIKKLRRGK